MPAPPIGAVAKRASAVFRSFRARCAKLARAVELAASSTAFSATFAASTAAARSVKLASAGSGTGLAKGELAWHW